MAALISVGGNTAGDGVLVAPVGANCETDLSLATNVGNLAVTPQASPNAASPVFALVNVDLSPAPTIVTVHPTLQSASRCDTVIQVLDGSTVVSAGEPREEVKPKSNPKTKAAPRRRTSSR